MISFVPDGTCSRSPNCFVRLVPAPGSKFAFAFVQTEAQNSLDDWEIADNNGSNVGP